VSDEIDPVFRCLVVLEAIAVSPCVYELLGESAGEGLVYIDSDLNTGPCPCPGCRARAALRDYPASREVREWQVEIYPRMAP
jgi:hypothetical protein